MRFLWQAANYSHRKFCYMKVKYCGPAKDYSGYGEAVRHDIAALVSANVQVTTQIPVYCLEVSDFGRLGELATSLEGKELGYVVKIIHTTPNTWGSFAEEGKYNIGRLFWETSKIPLDFSLKAQLMDEIWTGSEYNANAIRSAGVTKPIYIVPEAIDTSISPYDYEPYEVANTKDYKFYSIFEWTERKNPSALLEAYWREFENTEGVSLTIKTYVDNFTPEKQQEVADSIKRVKKKLNLNKYAPLYLFVGLMDRHQVYRFHRTFDCFVSAHRGEGWGIPQMEAMLMGNPIISTNCGGIHEYLTNKENAYLPSYRLVNLTENTRNKQWYTPDQQWAEVSIEELRQTMRRVFDNREEAKRVGVAGQKFVNERFSLKAVGKLMAERLHTIYNEPYEVA